jgi:hypothetical protein
MGQNWQSLGIAAGMTALGSLLIPLFLSPAKFFAGIFSPALLIAIPLAGFGAFVGKGISLTLGTEENRSMGIVAAGFGIGGLLIALIGGAALNIPGFFILGLFGGLGIGFAFLGTALSRLLVTAASTVTYGLSQTLLPKRIFLTGG